MAKIDLEKLFCDILKYSQRHGDYIQISDIEMALKEQGFKYEDGKMVKIKQGSDNSFKEKVEKFMLDNAAYLLGANSEDTTLFVAKHFFKLGEEEGRNYLHIEALLTADKLASAEMTGRLKERNDIISHPEKYGLEKPVGKNIITPKKDWAEISFGAKDSELIEERYYIHQGCYVEIKDGYVAIKKSDENKEEKI